MNSTQQILPLRQSVYSGQAPVQHQVQIHQNVQTLQSYPVQAVSIQQQVPAQQLVVQQQIPVQQVQQLQQVVVQQQPSIPVHQIQVVQQTPVYHQIQQVCEIQDYPQQVPYRGVPISQPESLNFSIANRKGDFAHISSINEQRRPGQAPPAYINEHIQRRPYKQNEEYQDLEGLDMIRIQASRVDTLLDRIEILEREIAKQVERESEFDNDFQFWDNQYNILERNRADSKKSIAELTLVAENDKISQYIDDKNEIERKITLKLREIEELGIELGYYKSICIPNDDESMELKRLQDTEIRLLASNQNLNKDLLVITHIQKVVYEEVEEKYLIE